MQIEKKKVVGDVALNFISALVPIIILQFAVYPLVAQKASDDQYGLMITIYSLLRMIAFSLGNVANNVRLINQSNYKENNIVGDFNFLLIIFCLIDIVLMSIGTIFYEMEFNIISLLLILSTSVFLLLDEYLEVAFRLNLNYKNILMNRCCLAVGYVVGLGLFYVTLRWEWIYLGGQLGSLIFLLKNTNLLKESFGKTKLFKKVSFDCGSLLCASLLGNAMNYADKLLLYPLLGGTGVAIYYAATLLGKMVSIAISPITGVVLSYLSHFSSIKNKTIFKILQAGVIVCAVGYVGTIIVTKPVLMLLYPQWVGDAMKLVPITTLATVVAAMCSLINPFTLKFCKTSWQLVINAVSTVVYIAATLLLIKGFGIIGFCWGTVIGCIAKFIIMMAIYFVVNKENKSE